MFEGVWKNVLPELSKDVDTKYLIANVVEIVKLANETKLDSINAYDIEKRVSNNDLKELVEQVYQDDEIKDEELKELSTNFLKKVGNNGNYESVYTKWFKFW